MKNDFKKYEAKVLLGISTDTLDNTGQVTKECDIGILDNIINVDYRYLIKTGIKLISLIPFLSSARKIKLTSKYKRFYNDM